MNIIRIFAHVNSMTEYELWEMFAKTGDIELYDMYRAMKENHEDAGKKKK